MTLLLFTLVLLFVIGGALMWSVHRCGYMFIGCGAILLIMLLIHLLAGDH